MPKYVKTLKGLARMCGVSMSTMQEFLKMPDAPSVTKSGWDIPAVQTFILATSRKESVQATLDSGMADLKKWDVYERARKAKLVNDQREGRLISRAEHERVISQMVAECQNILGSIPSRLAPDVAGLSVAEAEVAIRDMINEAVAKLHAG